jgi:hypothetical protein
MANFSVYRSTMSRAAGQTLAQHGIDRNIVSNRLSCQTQAELGELGR